MEVDFPHCEEKKKEFWPLKAMNSFMVTTMCLSQGCFFKWGIVGSPSQGDRLCYMPRNLPKERWTHLAHLVEGGLLLFIHP